MIKWPELLKEPINLWNAPVNYDGVPIADCGNCIYRNVDGDGHCFLFKQSVGNKCSQFKKDND